ncbi:hypothetical protein EG68_05750 [Paragonimus skrjabini miyazakii]|uniref:RRM domain-containing protein n=1 Tax=Paragonimus skrjabini miyazakii TaxID=59628 RepID=A0A8S9YYH5_9TREM|nr:hypothetical protein EG68_05750 [Paragonimus skrjabini miyazakii]
MIDVDNFWNNRMCPNKPLKNTVVGQGSYPVWAPSMMTVEAKDHSKTQQPQSKCSFGENVGDVNSSNVTTSQQLDTVSKSEPIYSMTPSSLFQRNRTTETDPPILPRNQDNQNAVFMSREEALVTLTEKTSYPILQENGQRRYGPPPDWVGPQPPRGCEVFIGKIPRDCFEDELVPIFETVGKIYMFRLMMDFSGCNRGYGFCIYTNREDTRRAVAELDSYEIRRGKTLGVCFSVDNCRLFVGGIPKTKSKDEIMTEMIKVTEGVKDVIVYPSVADKTKNRGFAFVEYENHKAAAMARRKLIPGRIHLWGHQIAVDWAEPEREVDEDIMSKVRILYVRNLMLHTTEEVLRDHFNGIIGACDAVERVKKIRDYAFVHFRDRMQANAALRQLDGTIFDGSQIEVTWAKPVDKNDNLRLGRASSAGLNGNTTAVQNYLANSLPNQRDTNKPMNLNLLGLPLNGAQIRFPVPGYGCQPTNSVRLTGLQTAAAPRLTAIKLGTACTDYQDFAKVNSFSNNVTTIMNNNVHPANFGTLAFLQPSSAAIVPSMLGTNNALMSTRPTVAERLTAGFAQTNTPAFATLSKTLHSEQGNKHGYKPIQNVSGLLVPMVESRQETRSMNWNLHDLSKTDNPQMEGAKETASYFTKVLSNLCIRQGLGIPQLTTHAHEAVDQITGRKSMMFTVHVFIPGLQRHFFTPTAMSSPDEATKTVVTATLQWLTTQLMCCRPSSKAVQSCSILLQPQLDDFSTQINRLSITGSVPHQAGLVNQNNAICHALVPNYNSSKASSAFIPTQGETFRTDLELSNNKHLVLEEKNAPPHYVDTNTDVIQTSSLETQNGSLTGPSTYKNASLNQTYCTETLLNSQTGIVKTGQGTLCDVDRSRIDEHETNPMLNDHHPFCVSPVVHREAEILRQQTPEITQNSINVTDAVAVGMCANGIRPHLAGAINSGNISHAETNCEILENISSSTSGASTERIVLPKSCSYFESNVIPTSHQIMHTTTELPKGTNCPKKPDKQLLLMVRQGLTDNQPVKLASSSIEQFVYDQPRKCIWSPDRLPNSNTCKTQSSIDDCQTECTSNTPGTSADQAQNTYKSLNQTFGQTHSELSGTKSGVITKTI